MRKKIPIFWFCLVGTIFLTVGVIFLPRYLSRSLDYRRMNYMEISNRTDFSFLKPASNDVVEVARAFQYLNTTGEEPVLLLSLEDPDQISKDLLAAVYEQSMIMSECGAIPWTGINDDLVETEDGYFIPSYYNWTEDVTFARSYSLTYESLEDPNKKEMLNFWYLNFSDGKRFDYTFIANAITYQIYYAKIYNESASYMATAYQMEHEMFSVGTDAVSGKSSIKSEEYTDSVTDAFSVGCENYYGAIGSSYVGQNTLYNKIGIAILYFDKKPESTQNIYVEKRIALEPFSDYLGISIGFQDLIRWAEELL